MPLGRLTSGAGLHAVLILHVHVDIHAESMQCTCNTPYMPCRVPMSVGTYFTSLSRPCACRPARTPIYSDRFIPSRADSSRLQGYSLLDRAQAADEPYRNPQAREEGSSAYNHMLRTELLGINGLDTPSQIGCRSPMHRWVLSHSCCFGSSTLHVTDCDVLN